jgi:hypothetical protein
MSNQLLKETGENATDTYKIFKVYEEEPMCET